MGQSGQKTIAGQVQKTRLTCKYIPAVSKGQSCSGEVKAGAVAHVPSSDKLPGEQSHLLFWKPGVRSSTEGKAARAAACTRTLKPLSLEWWLFLGSVGCSSTCFFVFTSLFSSSQCLRWVSKEALPYFCLPSLRFMVSLGILR